ncbi:BTAD domain-containing putative transcriptional regulator [Desulfobacterales bacterium HSG16]|nr:BTAD domain-containing putative transcriptional regulator [Desulfobacterales bacterium HSG16]
MTWNFSTYEMKLQAPYASLMEQERWDEYLSALNEEGLTWWFNTNISCLITHLIPLISLHRKFAVPERLLFLSKIVNRQISSGEMKETYEAFASDNDFETAAAAVGYALISIWESGKDFAQFDDWYKKIDFLLNTSKTLSPLARAFLLGCRGWIELSAKENPAKAMKTAESALSWSKRAGSASLRVYNAVIIGYSCLFQADFSRLESIMDVTTLLCELEETALIAKFSFKNILSAFYMTCGNISKAERIMLEIVSHPFFESLPLSSWLSINSHFQILSVIKGDTKKIKDIKNKIRKRDIPEEHKYYRGYFHYIIGVAFLAEGNPKNALYHAEKAMKNIRYSNGFFLKLYSEFLFGQALSDLSKTKDAIKHFSKWLDIRHKKTHTLFRIHGFMELANLYVKQGQLEKARKIYETASCQWPHSKSKYVFNRTKNFIEHLNRSLFPEIKADVQDIAGGFAPVHIETMGKLLVRIDGQTIYDRDWRGERTKDLLKAMIVFGATKVPSVLLVDTLWPDSDGDHAAANLKVAISRLRNIGQSKDHDVKLQWVFVRHHHVSLSKSMCYIDSIQFKELLTASLKKKEETALLFEALDIYKDDFLVHEIDDAWIITHREKLRKDFISGVITLSERCINSGRPEQAVPYLLKAVEKHPLHGNAYAQLMHSYITMGFPSNALQVYMQAKEIFNSQLGIEPGPILSSLAEKASAPIG